jgi:hypothetical protein
MQDAVDAPGPGTYICMNMYGGWLVVGFLEAPISPSTTFTESRHQSEE